LKKKQSDYWDDDQGEFSDTEESEEEAEYESKNFWGYN